MPSPGGVDGIIGFYHRDFNPDDALCGDGCNIFYTTGGTDPNRWWGITFDRVPICCSADPPDPVTVQVILYEGTNEIKVQVQEAGVSDLGVVEVETCEASESF